MRFFFLIAYFVHLLFGKFFALLQSSGQVRILNENNMLLFLVFTKIYMDLILTLEMWMENNALGNTSNIEL